jgi:hypothetical protein
MSTTLEKLKTRGFWKVVFFPNDFVEKRIEEIGALEKTVRESAVAFRGWDFPHVGREGPVIGVNWISGEVDWNDHVESWRLYQSGQFVYYGAIRTDWFDQDRWEKLAVDWKAGERLPVTDTVFRFTEIFEFASRLAVGILEADSYTLEISISGLADRQLWIDNPMRSGFSFPRRAQIPEFPQSFQLPRQQLLGEVRDLPIRASSELFARFGWEPGVDFLKQMQSELFRR